VKPLFVGKLVQALEIIELLFFGSAVKPNRFGDRQSPPGRREVDDMLAEGDLQ
jgi:hypothetical protein